LTTFVYAMLAEQELLVLIVQLPDLSFLQQMGNPTFAAILGLMANGVVYFLNLS